MSPWIGWVLDARFHLVLFVAVIAGAISANTSVRSSESNWRTKQIAALRQRPPQVPDVSPALARLESFTTAARSAEGR